MVLLHYLSYLIFTIITKLVNKETVSYKGKRTPRITKKVNARARPELRDSAFYSNAHLTTVPWLTQETHGETVV